MGPGPLPPAPGEGGGSNPGPSSLPSGKTWEPGEPSRRNPRPDPPAASPAQAPVPCPATGGRDVICLPLKCGGECRKLGAAFAPPAALEPIRGSVSFGGTKVVAGKLWVFLRPEVLFSLVSPENLLQKLANIGKWKPKEIIAVCFPGGGAGRINPFVIFPHAGQADTRWGR